MVLPVVERELRSASRRPATYRLRAVFFFLSLVILSVQFADISHRPLSYIGSSLFLTMSMLTLGYAALVGVVVSSDCISEEKREGTLGLLFLTPLSTHDVVLGKLAVSSLSAFYGFISVVPVLALPLLFGGVTLTDVFLLVAYTLGLMFFSLSAGLFVSVWGTDARRGMFATLLILFLWVFAPLILIMIVSFRTNTAPTSFFSSPITMVGYTIERNSFGAGGMFGIRSVWVSAAYQYAGGFILLLLAILCLPGRIKSEVRQGGGWQTKVSQAAYGTRVSRKKMRSRLLSINPICWLSSRHYWNPYMVWGFVLLLYVGIPIWYLSRFGTLVAGEILLFLPFLLHPIFKIWMLSYCSQTLLEARKSGALELLLCTPLTPKTIVKGYWKGVIRAFGGPALFIVIAEFLLLPILCTYWGQDNGWSTGPPGWSKRPNDTYKYFFLAGPALFIVDFICIPWIAMADSMNSNSLQRSMSKSFAQLFLLPGFLLLCSAMMSIHNGGDDFYYYGVWFWVCLGANLFFTVRACRLLRRDFRVLAVGTATPKSWLQTLRKFMTPRPRKLAL